METKEKTYEKIEIKEKRNLNDTFSRLFNNSENFDEISNIEEDDEMENILKTENQPRISLPNSPSNVSSIPSPTRTYSPKISKISKNSKVSTSTSEIFDKNRTLSGKLFPWYHRQYHHYDVDFSSLDSRKINSVLSTIRKPKKSSNPTQNPLSFSDTYLSLRFEEEKLKQKYLQSKNGGNRIKDYWYEMRTEDFNDELAKNSVDYKDFYKTFKIKKKREKRKKKKKRKDANRNFWKYTYSKSRFFDTNIFPKHFIK